MKLIKVFSKTCGPCKVLDKNLKESGVEYDSVDIESDEGDNLIEKYNIRNVPTLLLVSDDGTLVDKHVGVLNVEAIKNFISK